MRKRQVDLYNRRKRYPKYTFKSYYRPRWHRIFWKKYYFITPAEDSISRGVQYANTRCAHIKYAPSLLAWAALHSHSWEEDEWEMYEQEFEDWDLEYDEEMGEINFDGLDMERDEDLYTYKKYESEYWKAMREAEGLQAAADEDSFQRDYATVENMEFDVDDDYMPIEVIEDPWLDPMQNPDLLQFGVDMWGGIFEYFSDPRWDSQVKSNMEFDAPGIPPAWGSLGVFGMEGRNLLDRADGLIYGYYGHNFVDIDKGVTFTPWWWDGMKKSWAHDGHSASLIDYMTEGKVLDSLAVWYIEEYLVAKQEYEPKIYSMIQDLDKETRQNKPHYHGLAFIRGYADRPKRDEFEYYQNMVDTFTEEESNLYWEYVAKLGEREERGEFIADDDYITFEGGKYNLGGTPDPESPEENKN